MVRAPPRPPPWRVARDYFRNHPLNKKWIRVAALAGIILFCRFGLEQSITRTILVAFAFRFLIQKDTTNPGHHHRDGRRRDRRTPATPEFELLERERLELTESSALTREQRAERVVNYDERSYGFVRLAEDAIRAAEARNSLRLARLHDDDDDDDANAERRRPMLERLHLAATEHALSSQTPTGNPFVAALVSEVRSSRAFAVALREFIREEVCPALGVKRVAYQRKPTFRVHLAGAPAQGMPHADGLRPHNRQPNEVNVWVPLTRVGAWGGGGGGGDGGDGGKNHPSTNSLVCESEPGARDFHPLVASPGQFVKFYGCACWHFTTRNDTDVTRVSFDVRVVPFRLHDDDRPGPSKAGKGRGGKPLRLGEHYVDSDAPLDY
jgi:hypothetical protein